MGFSFLKLISRVAMSNINRLGFPYKLRFALTYNCNSCCKICNIWKRDSRNELKLEEIKEFFKQNNRFSWIDLTGGEIFLRDDLCDLLKSILYYCRELYVLHFSTNGLLTDQIIKKVKSILPLKNVKMVITVSLDGPEDLHNELRGVVGGYENALKTFKGLKELNGIEVYFGMTLSCYNLDKVEETYQSIKERIDGINYEDLHINIAHKSEHFYGNWDLPDIQRELAIQEIMGVLKKRRWRLTPAVFLENIYMRNIETYLISGKTPFRCQALSATCFIDPYGNIYPCNIYNEKIGNIRTPNFSLKELWHTQAVKDLRRKILEYKCPSCWSPCEAYPAILGAMLGF